MYTCLFTLVFFCDYELRSLPRSVCLLICCFKFILSASLRSLSIHGLLFFSLFFFTTFSLCLYPTFYFPLSLLIHIYIYLCVYLSFFQVIHCLRPLLSRLGCFFHPSLRSRHFNLASACYVILCYRINQYQGRRMKKRAGK